MPAVLVLIAAMFTWAALYQGFVGYVVAPPRAGELATVSGILRHVDTPVTRNRFVPAIELQIEAADLRLHRIPARAETLALAEARSLVGAPVSATSAQGRPRNRWLYALSASGRTIVALADETARDEAARTRALTLGGANAIVAAGLFAASARLRRRHGRRSDPAPSL